MISTQTIPLLLIFSFLLLFVSAFIHFFIGRTNRRLSEGFFYGSLGVAGIFLILDWVIFTRESLEPLSWLKGWVGSRHQLGALNVGLFQDALGLCVTSAALILLSVFIPKSKSEPEVDKIFGSVSFSLLGLSIIWFSLTPWLTILGLGFIVCGILTADVEEARQGFGWTFVWALTLCSFGALMLSGNRMAWEWKELDVDATAARSDYLDVLGGYLFAGASVHLVRVFPFFGSLFSLKSSDDPRLPGKLASRIFQTQIFPMIAVLGLMTRAEPLLRKMGIFPEIGWYFLTVSLLTLLAGWAASTWQSVLIAWMSAGFSLALAVLSLLGPLPALQMTISLILVGIAFSISLDRIHCVENPSGKINNPAFLWVKVFLFICVLLGVGFFGSVSTGSWSQLFSHLWDSTSGMVFFGAAFFLFVLLGGRLGWVAVRSQSGNAIQWPTHLLLFCLVALSLSLVWNGTLIGEIEAGSRDQLLPSVLEMGMKISRIDVKTIEPAQSAWILYGFFIFLGFGLSALASLRQPSLWDRIQTKAPRLVRVVRQSYGLGIGIRFVFVFFRRVGAFLQYWIDHKAWDQWIPIFFDRLTLQTANLAAKGDAKIARWPGKGLFTAINSLARLAQFTQSGDVQWYLFFAIGAGLGLFIIFLKA